MVYTNYVLYYISCSVWSCVTVFGEKARVRHYLVRVSADYSRSDSAAWRPHLWKVWMRLHYLICNLSYTIDITMQLFGISFVHIIGRDVIVSFSRFADIFGARAALSVSCVASVIYFLLLTVADSPFMLFVHKLPAVFMHALPGNPCILTQIQLSQIHTVHIQCSA